MNEITFTTNPQTVNMTPYLFQPKAFVVNWVASDAVDTQGIGYLSVISPELYSMFNEKFISRRNAVTSQIIASLPLTFASGANRTFSVHTVDNDYTVNQMSRADVHRFRIQLLKPDGTPVIIAGGEKVTLSINFNFYFVIK